MTAGIGLALKRLAKHGLQWPERVLHPVRRAALRDRLRAQGRPREVLILCHGNICRSPYAEARLRASATAAGVDIYIIESAGFLAPGRPAHDLALQIAAARGLDLSAHRSRRVGGERLPPKSMVIVMTRPQAIAVTTSGTALPHQVAILGDLDPQPVGSRDIPDPYGGPPELFVEVFDRIDRCVDALVHEWARIR